MITNVSDFKYATEFECLLLDRILPKVSSDTMIDLRNPQQQKITLSFSESFCENARAGLTAEMLPLLFGAAWKILDLLVELALIRKCPNQVRWTIDDKVRKALNGDWAFLTTDQSLLNALCIAYKKTVEHRHCLVHRTAVYSNGELTGRDKLGNFLTPLKQGELYAFVRLAQLVVDAVISVSSNQTGALDNQPRFLDRVRFELDCLKSHTNIQVSSGKREGSTVIVRIALTAIPPSQYEVDFNCVREQVKSASSDYYDLWIEIPSQPGRILFGYLEETPCEKVQINLTDIPPYLKWK